MSISLPRTNRPFVIRSASGTCLKDWKSLSSPQTKAGSRAKEREGGSYLSFHLDGLPSQVLPCHFRDACHRPIWPQNVRIQGILTLGPLPSLQQFLSKSYFQLHHLLMPTDDDPVVYTQWDPDLYAFPLVVLSAWNSLLTSSSWKDTYVVVNSSRKTACCSGEQSHFYNTYRDR